MSTHRAVVSLTVLNLVLLVFLLTSAARPALARPEARVLRGSALEIVDAHGRVRASIGVFPPSPNVKMPDGTIGYPETVLFRLTTSDGRPNVKLAAKEDGAALVLGGESDPTYIQLLSQGETTFVKLSNKDRREQVIRP